MEKITERNFIFEGKEKDYSKTFDYRILETKKRILDIIDEYSQFDEPTEFFICKGEEVKTTFSHLDYRNDNVELTLKQGASLCMSLKIVEKIFKTLKNETQEAQNLVQERKIYLIY